MVPAVSFIVFTSNSTPYYPKSSVRGSAYGLLSMPKKTSYPSPEHCEITSAIGASFDRRSAAINE